MSGKPFFGLSWTVVMWMVMMVVVVRVPASGSWKQKPICIVLPVVGSVNNHLLDHVKGQATMATPRNHGVSSRARCQKTCVLAPVEPSSKLSSVTGD